MKKLYLKLLAIVTAMLVCSGLYAQVTVGSNLEPNTGAILDIKEYKPNLQIDNTTANKGMLLPRVNLTDMSNLYPMFLNDTDYVNNTDSKKNTEDTDHTGLVVYNVNLDICDEIYPGTYVWDGQEWSRLTDEYPFPSETDILVDNRDPNKIEQYKIGKFGDAGWWMLENIRADRYSDGTKLFFAHPSEYVLWPDRTPTMINPPPYQTSLQTAYYPMLSEEVFASNPHYGYIYNYMGARNMTLEEILASAGQELFVQGICPDGWHLPSEADWTELVTAVRTNPCQYAHSKINENTGFNMMSMTGTPNGVSRSWEQGGFNGELIGRPKFTYDAVTRITEHTMIEVGSRGYFWLNTIQPNSGTYYGIMATFDRDLNQAAKLNTSAHSKVSVRCKKDDITRKSNTSAAKVSSVSFIKTLSE